MGGIQQLGNILQQPLQIDHQQYLLTGFSGNEIFTERSRINHRTGQRY